MSEVEHYMNKAASARADADNLARLVNELRAEVRMAGVIFDGLIKTCAPLLALYPDDDLSWDEVVGIAAEDLVELRRDRDRLLARGGGLARMGCPNCGHEADAPLPEMRCMRCGTAYYRTDITEGGKA